MLGKLGPLIVSIALAACYSGTVAYTSPTATVAVSTPDLAYVAPGVQVIADYDEPIFYSGGFYWYNANGAWYRSPRYTGGWAYVAAPPYAIRTIRSPYAYRHYRPYGYVPRYRPVPYYRVQRPGYDDRYDRYRSDRYRYDRDRYRSDQYRYDRYRSDQYRYDRDRYDRDRYDRGRYDRGYSTPPRTYDSRDRSARPGTYQPRAPSRPSGGYYGTGSRR